MRLTYILIGIVIIVIAWISVAVQNKATADTAVTTASNSACAAWLERHYGEYRISQITSGDSGREPTFAYRNSTWVGGTLCGVVAEASELKIAK